MQMAYLGPSEHFISPFPTQLVQCLRKFPPLHSVTFLMKTEDNINLWI